MRETTNLGVEILNSKRQIKRKLDHVVQKFVFDLNVILNLSLKKRFARKFGRDNRPTMQKVYPFPFDICHSKMTLLKLTKQHD